VKVPPGGRLGLLLSVAELLHDGVETAKATSRAPARKNLPYVFYKKQYDLLDAILKFNALSVRINLQGTEGIRTYVFKLHKDALQEQLSCFLKEKEEKKKK